MTSISTNTPVGDDDLSRPDTPLASQMTPHADTASNTSVETPPVQQNLDFEAIPLTEPNDLQPDNLLLPIPTSLANNSQSSFSSSDVVDDTNGSDPLSPEIASADISVAPDGSFVETPSGLAAREIKRYWDQHIGVGKSVRSPYAITAFVNQHGKSMFRVGRREMSAPGASSAEVEERIIQSTSPSESSSSPRSQRRSRMSMHAFLPPSMFKGGSISSVKSQVAVNQLSGPRKLRKTRSIPDMGSLTVIDGSSESSPSYNGTPPALMGRAHSHTVTGADVSPFSIVTGSRPRGRDIFGDIMDLVAPTPGASTSFSTHSLFLPRQASNEPYDHSKPPAMITHPFGLGVTFDSPVTFDSSSRKPAIEFLPAPRLLREMQSFESGLTARQSEPLKHSGRDSSAVLETNSPDFEANRPPSALRLYPSSPPSGQTDSPASGHPEIILSPSPETTMLSRYSADVFDVLQTYRGLPLLEKLSDGLGETTVIKMSLSSDETAAPRDDPRFVIWGEILVERDHDDKSVSHESLTDPPANSSSMSRRRNTKAKAPEPQTVEAPQGEGTQKVIIAATIERWIAQLTSDLNYDELLDFFLTYRTYVSAVDLCHLLICRLHWALQHPISPHDEKVRRIVRVRTFVAIRFWILTFFTVDFLPNRELRLLVAKWLNTLIRDPILEQHADGQSIVRKLIKVVKSCKQAHTRPVPKSKPRSSSAPTRPAQQHVLGAKFAAATRKPEPEDEDSDVDLDFLPEENDLSDIPQGFPNDPVNAHLNAAHVGAGISPTRPASIPFSSFSILQRTDRAPGPNTGLDVPFVQTAATLPIHHSALSRAFVKTIGRLGRWKRVLNSRSAARTSLGTCADVSAFDLELNVPRDLLTVNGGVEQYLKMVGPHLSTPPATTEQPTVTNPLSVIEAPPSTLTTPTVTRGPAFSDAEPAPKVSVPSIVETLDSGHSSSETHESSHELTIPPDTSHEVADADTNNEPIIQAMDDLDVPELEGRASSIRSSSTDSFGRPLTSGDPPPSFPPLSKPQWQFDVVSIDELDFSDTSSDDHIVGPASPPGLRRPLRKLPLRRDFEFVRRETVSSMGIASRDSVASVSSAVSSSSAAGLGGNIAQWQMNALLDSLSDDDEAGDVEDALRILEGQIHPQRQRERASKVDGWVRTIQERMASGDYEDVEPRLSDDEDYDDGLEPEHGSGDGHGSASQHDAGGPLVIEPEDPSADDGTSDVVNTPIPTQMSHIIPVPPGPESPTRSEDAKPALEEAVPLEILQSRVSSRPSTASSQKIPAPLFAKSEAALRIYRSFVFNHRATHLAEHFAMIDRELFMGVKFEELVLGDWMTCEEVDVLDWAQYLKDRARWKAEKRHADKISALAAVRARFNLMANFVISEIALTQPNERPLLVAKFIRIAWKSYGMYDFGTLVAIIAGLRSEWVAKAMRKPFWSRVGIWENRMFKDLKVFTSNLDDFMYIRQIVESIVDAKPIDAGSHAASVVSGGGTDSQSGKGRSAPERPSVCIPFIGVYLSQLRRHSKLPDLIDPTAPNEAIGVNPITSNFDAPAHPEVFSTLTPLPPSMHLEPLINVHKQRRIAGVIKALVAGQHLASRVQFDVDRRLFQKCLRIRGLDSETLQQALAVYSD